MERVKGEKYWSVVQTKHGFEVCDFIDDFDEWDNADYEIGNRFPDRESAEAMAEKFRAVLKGVDVIEMPESNEVDMIQREIGLEVGGEDEELVEAASLGAIKMINWLIDKIVK